MLRSVFKEGNLHLHGPWTRKASLSMRYFPRAVKDLSGQGKEHGALQGSINQSWIQQELGDLSHLFRKQLPHEISQCSCETAKTHPGTSVLPCWSKQMSTEDVGEWAVFLCSLLCNHTGSVWIADPHMPPTAATKRIITKNVVFCSTKSLFPY